MISIRNAEIINDGVSAILRAKVSIPESAREKWAVFSRDAANYGDYSYLSDDYVNHLDESFYVTYSVEASYAQYLTDEVGDAFIVALLYYAIATEEDIAYEGSISTRLYLSLNSELLPLLCSASGRRVVHVEASVIDGAFSPGMSVGTGMSAGVDSLYTLQQFGDDKVPAWQRITHLTNFDVGAERYYFPATLDKEVRRKCLEKFVANKKLRIERAKTISNASGKAFVSVDSNISDLYCGCFERSHLFRTLSAAFSIQKLFSIYYVSSSGCSIDDYSLGIQFDPAHYEQVLLPLLSTDSIKFVMAGKQATRLDKLDALSSFDIAKRYLLVCGRGETHCYSCSKEYRTMVAIEVLGKQSEYAEVFDPAQCKRARINAYEWLLRDKRHKSATSYYLYKQAQKLKLIPWQSYVKYFLRKCRDAIIYRKIG